MQNTFDRTKIPEAGPIAAFTLLNEEKLSRVRLSNGINLLLYRYKKLPIVQLYLIIHSGAFTDPAEKAGMTNLFAEMIDEGTKSRTALRIADDFDFLGTNFYTWSSMDGCGVSLLTLREHVDASLDIFSDIIQNPEFPGTELERIRKNVLTGILQEEDQPNVLATNLFVRTIYGMAHPYGYPRLGTDKSVQSITGEELKQKYNTYCKPNNASLIVVGDIDMQELIGKLEGALSEWRQGTIPSVDLPEIPDRRQSEIYVIDRPDAVQSQIRIGHRGLERTHEYFFPIRVMNQILGGQFTSRINLNLREDKGYTYGASSVWEMRKFGGHFMTTGGFQADFTDRSVDEIMKELYRIREEGVTETELTMAKEGLIRSLPRQFETPSQIATQLANVLLYGLPDDYFDTYIDNIYRVSTEDVKKVATECLHPSKVAVVVVGDFKKIKTPLENLGIGEVIEVDHKG
jgi:zinc protease